MADIFDFMGCEGCPYYKFHRGKTWGEPDTCYPDEVECLDGGFGDDYPCERMLFRIKEGLQDGDFAFSRSYLVSKWSLIECEDDYEDVLKAWPDIDWNKHLYWQVFYDETAPVGFDTLEKVYEGVFQ